MKAEQQHAHMPSPVTPEENNPHLSLVDIPLTDWVVLLEL